MNNRVRVALAVVACLVGLTGCVKVDADLEVNSDETVSGTMKVGVDKQLVQASGQSLDQIRQQVESGIKQTSTQGVECKAFEDDKFVGSSCTLDKVPFADMGSSSGEGVGFRKDGDQFVVTVKSPALDSYPQTGQQPDVKFKITMPGKIVEHDPGASVSGRTATYDSLDKISSVTLRSEAGGGFPLWAIILIAVLLLAALGALLYFLSRRGKKRGQPGQYPPSQYPSGQYPAGQYPSGQAPAGQWGPQYGSQPGEQPMQYGAQPGEQPMQYGAQPGEQPMQYGQPGQPMQYGQPDQPMQYGQPAPGQHPGQQGQGQQGQGQPGPWGAPGQYPGQPPREQQPPGGQQPPPGQQPQGGWGQPSQPGRQGWNPPPQRGGPQGDEERPPQGDADGRPEQS